MAGEVTLGCHPLGRNNKIIFASGLLAGTNAANSGILLEESKKATLVEMLFSAVSVADVIWATFAYATMGRCLPAPP